MSQEQGWVGRCVGGMVRRSVRSRFRNLYWTPVQVPEPPVIFAVNHHGWHDGYVMFHLITKLGIRCVDWVEEFDAFPPFRSIGAMPFDPKQPAVRAQTIRQTIRLMNQDRRSLVLFAEGVLHRGPEVLEFGGALELVARRVPEAKVIPVGIVYDMSLHERPEAFVRLGQAVPRSTDLAKETRDQLVELLSGIRVDVREHPESFDVLAPGTPSVNERWDLRRRKLR